MFSLLMASAHAQTTAAAAPQQPNAFMSLMPLFLVFIIFYFLMIRPQKKRADQEREYLANLQKGTEVYTKSGIIGTITAMTDKVVTLEVESGTKLKVLRSQIGGGLSDLFAKANKDKPAASKA